MKTLKQLIKEKDWYYVNPDITDKNFPRPEVIETENPQLIYLEKGMSSQECLDLIKSKGMRPANCWELITYMNAHGEELRKRKGYIALGQTWKDSDGDHWVPYVYRYSDGGFEFFLGDFEIPWFDDYCLLAFCDKELGPSDTLETSDPLSLESAIEMVKKEGYVVYKIM